MKKVRQTTYLNIGALIAIGLCAMAFLLSFQQALQSYLFAWLTILGISLGAMANLMLHTLTGGRWGTLLYVPFVKAIRLIPLVAVLSIPLLLSIHLMLPWANGTEHHIPNSWWLNRDFFFARSITYLLIWISIATLWLRSTRHETATSPRKSNPYIISAAGLIVYTFSMSLAAIDWISSLLPRWYSSGFGLVVISAQLLGSMAFGIATAADHPTDTPVRSDIKEPYHDLGNLLLMYVMLWAYVAFTQFLIIWAEDLPREILWYTVRLHTNWRFVSIFLATFLFFIPLFILLSRTAKRSPKKLRSTAFMVLLIYIVDIFWLVAPSLRPNEIVVYWSDPLVLLGVGGLWCIAWMRLDFGHPMAMPRFDSAVSRYEFKKSKRAPCAPSKKNAQYRNN